MGPSTSEESQSVETLGSRELRPAERGLVEAMLRANHDERAIADFVRYRVQDMQDGGMGSIRFLPTARTRQFGKALANAEYTDEDGVLVSITLNGDDNGEPYELDIWKVDFSPLKRYPKPSELRLKA